MKGMRSEGKREKRRVKRKKCVGKVTVRGRVGG